MAFRVPRSAFRLLIPFLSAAIPHASGQTTQDLNDFDNTGPSGDIGHNFAFNSPGDVPTGVSFTSLEAPADTFIASLGAHLDLTASSVVPVAFSGSGTVTFTGTVTYGEVYFGTGTLPAVTTDFPLSQRIDTGPINVTFVAGEIPFVYYDLPEPPSTPGFDARLRDFLGNGQNTIIVLTLDPVATGGGNEEVFLATTNQGSPAAVIAPNGNGTGAPRNMDPIVIIDIGAQNSANTSGAATIAGVNNGSISSFSGFTSNIGNHLHGIAGFAGFGGGFAFHRPNPWLNIAIAGAEDRWTGAIHPFAGVAKAPVVVEVKPRNWEIFTMGAFNRRDQDRIGLDPGFKGDTWTGTVGIERRLGQQLLVGFATTLGSQNVTTPGKLGNADIDGTLLDAYAVYAKDHFWTSLRYGIGFQDIAIDRRAFPGVTARAETESLNHVIGWGAGLNEPLNLFGMEFIHGPQFGLEYMTGEIDGYTEHGGGAFDLIVDDHAWASLESELGWSIAKAHDLGKLGKGFLQLRASWNHEHLHDESNTEFSLENSPVRIFDPATGLTTDGPNTFRGRGHNATPQNDYMSIGLHLTQFLGARELWTLRAGYETQLFRSDYSEHYFYGQLGTAF